ncbi:hypothetical protein BC342_19480 [Streptomyces olivaceus]|nr:hypothetical protein BC342_19480 [Streptomyces olivaceus]
MTGSMPWARQAARIVGKRCSHIAAPKWRASRYMCSAPCSCMRRVMPLATMSRGASSPSSCCPCMKRTPSASTRWAPSPRTASETRGCWPSASAPRKRTVGWNWTNSRSLTSAPARRASATPSPVETDGLVVAEKTWPMPPVARTTAGAWTAPTPSCRPSPMTCRVTPAVRPAVSVRRSRTRAFSTVRMPRARTAPTRAREISAPVASPPAWAMRRRWWPPSRVRARAPPADSSKCAPVAMRRRTASGPSVTRVRTAASSHRPTPATRVSSRCCSGVSPSPRAAAMPPCAQRVEPSSRRALVTTTVRRPAASQRRAAVSPATPEPTTTTSASRAQPGAGACRRMPVPVGRVPVLVTRRLRGFRG